MQGVLWCHGIGCTVQRQVFGPRRSISGATGGWASLLSTCGGGAGWVLLYCPRAGTRLERLRLFVLAAQRALLLHDQRLKPGKQRLLVRFPAPHPTGTVLRPRSDVHVQRSTAQRSLWAGRRRHGGARVAARPAAGKEGAPQGRVQWVVHINAAASTSLARAQSGTARLATWQHRSEGRNDEARDARERGL